MKNLWHNYNQVLMNTAGDGNGGGGAGGASSIVTPPNGGSGSPPPQGNPNPQAGAAGNNPPAGNLNPSGTSSGQGGQDWRSQLPSELQEDASIKKYGSVSALAGAYVNLHKLIGKDKIIVPGAETSDDQWQEIFQKLGQPKELKDYGVKFKDGVQLEQKFTDEFKANAHKLGILPRQAQALADWFSDINLKSASDMQKQADDRARQNVDAVKQEWGKAFDAKAARVNKLIHEHGGEEAQNHFFKMGYGADPMVLKVLSAAADKLYKENRVRGEDGGGSNDFLSPAEARAEALKITGDKAHPYNVKDHPGHKDAVLKVNKLWEMAIPQNSSVQR